MDFGSRIDDNTNYFAQSEATKLLKKKQNKLLSISLLWFSLGIFITFLFAGLFSYIPALGKLIVRPESKDTFQPWLVILIALAAQIGVSIVIRSFFNIKKLGSIKTVWLAVGYAIYVASSTIILTIMATFLKWSGYLDGSTLTLSFLIPFAIFVVTGLLGYFGIIKFEKLWPIIIVCLVASFIVMITTMFTVFRNQKAYSLLSVLFIVIATISIGINFRAIRLATESTKNNLDNVSMWNLGLFFGFDLYTNLYSLTLQTLSLFSYLKS
ncbi:MAG0110 family membrane protein [Mycoplasma sp. 128]|uniref:MAG0110 family membrane protein n=1 Tax=Mycoplasma sp. 3341 TaxID=3447506 RepID=UPI003F65BB73